jgi:hypothetical protein
MAWINSLHTKDTVSFTWLDSDKTTGFFYKKGAFIEALFLFYERLNSLIGLPCLSIIDLNVLEKSN